MDDAHQRKHCNDQHHRQHDESSNHNDDDVHIYNDNEQEEEDDDDQDNDQYEYENDDIVGDLNNINNMMMISQQPQTQQAKKKNQTTATTTTRFNRWIQKQTFLLRSSTSKDWTSKEFASQIDDSLQNLSHYNNDEYFPSHTNNDTSSTNSDWILDGHLEWKQQYNKTQQLLHKLHQDPLQDFLINSNTNSITMDDNENENDESEKSSSNDDNNDEETNNENVLLLLKFGSVGNQEFQFASFEDAFPTIETKTTESITNESKSETIETETKTKSEKVIEDEEVRESETTAASKTETNKSSQNEKVIIIKDEERTKEEGEAKEEAKETETKEEEEETNNKDEDEEKVNDNDICDREAVQQKEEYTTKSSSEVVVVVNDENENENEKENMKNDENEDEDEKKEETTELLQPPLPPSQPPSTQEEEKEEEEKSTTAENHNSSNTTEMKKKAIITATTPTTTSTTSSAARPTSSTTTSKEEEEPSSPSSSKQDDHVENKEEEKKNQDDHDPKQQKQKQKDDEGVFRISQNHHHSLLDDDDDDDDDEHEDRDDDDAEEEEEDGAEEEEDDDQDNHNNKNVVKMMIQQQQQENEKDEKGQDGDKGSHCDNNNNNNNNNKDSAPPPPPPPTSSSILLLDEELSTTSTKNSSRLSIPSTIEWMIPTTTTNKNPTTLLTKTLSNKRLQLQIGTDVMNNNNNETTHNNVTTDNNIMTTSSSLLTSEELASPEGRFLRRKSSQPLHYFGDGDNNDEDKDQTNDMFDDDDDNEKDPEAIIIKKRQQQQILDVSDLSIPTVFFFEDTSQVGTGIGINKNNTIYFDDTHYLTALGWDWWPWVLQDDPLWYDHDDNNDDDHHHDNDNNDDYDPDHNNRNIKKRNNDTVFLLQEEIAQQLSQLDTWHRSICQRLYQHVGPHAKPLQNANQAALDLTRDITVSLMHVNRCHESINLARYGNINNHNNNNNKNMMIEEEEEDHDDDDDDISNRIPGGVQAAWDLLEALDKKDSYHDLESVLEYIHYIYNFESDIQERIQQFDIRLPTALSDLRAILTDIQWLKKVLVVDVGGNYDDDDDGVEDDGGGNDDDDGGMVDHLREQHQSSRPRPHPSISNCIALQDIKKRCLQDEQLFHLVQRMNLFLGLVECQERSIQALFVLNQNPDSVVATIITTIFRQANCAWRCALLYPTQSEDNFQEEQEEYETELLHIATTTSGTLYGSEVPAEEEDGISKLMEIRFDFEANAKFPSIFHKLCVLLYDVLFSAYDLLSSMSSSISRQDLEESHLEYIRIIYGQLEQRRASIWNTCIATLERSLEEYASWAKKNQKQRKQAQEVEMSPDKGFQEWEGLKDVSRLAFQFLSLQSEFGVASNDSANDGTCLRECLQNIFKHHLRSEYVDAMNAMGKQLNEEDWTTLVPLVPASSTSSTTSASTSDDAHVGATIQKIIGGLLMDPWWENRHAVAPSLCRSQFNLFCTAKRGHYFQCFREHGNPFDVNVLPKTEEKHDSQVMATDIFSDFVRASSEMQAIYDLLAIHCGSNTSLAPIMLPKSFACGLLTFTSRVIRIVWHVPPISEDAYEVLSNMFDLYKTTLFRICVGSSAAERILLQVANDQDDNKSTTSQNQKQQQEALPSSPLFGFRRRSSSSAMSSVKSLSKKYLRPSTLGNEAEIIAPITKEQMVVATLRKRIMSAQQNLDGIVKLDLVDSWVVDHPAPKSGAKSGTTPLNLSVVEVACQAARVLEKRQVALWSSVFLATLLHSVVGCLASCEQDEVQQDEAQPDFHSVKGIMLSSSLKSFLETYVTSFITSVPGLVSIMNRAACVRAVGGRKVVEEIISVGSEWEESKKLHEHPNQYVDDLCDLSAFLWCSLSNANKLSTSILQFVWEGIVECGYLSLLDGFSRIPYCSTEGRALMSIDLQSFSSGIRPESIAERLEGHVSKLLPKDVSHTTATQTLSDPVRDMRYVDTYIKVFYFPPEDAMGWIEENYENYLEDHMIALIVGAAMSSSEEDRTTIRLGDLVGKVSGLYHNDE